MIIISDCHVSSDHSGHMCQLGVTESLCLEHVTTECNV